MFTIDKTSVEQEQHVPFSAFRYGWSSGRAGGNDEFQLCQERKRWAILLHFSHFARHVFVSAFIQQVRYNTKTKSLLLLYYLLISSFLISHHIRWSSSEKKEKRDSIPIITSMARVRITPSSQRNLMRVATVTAIPRIHATRLVPFKLTTTQTIFTAAPTEIMKITGITATTNQTVSDSEIVPESALHNELLALIVLLCLLVIGVIIYFIFRSMVYIKKVSFPMFRIYGE